MFWKTLYGVLFISNAVSMTAITFFGWTPTLHQVAGAAFFGAGCGCLAMFSQS